MLIHFEKHYCLHPRSIHTTLSQQIVFKIVNCIFIVVEPNQKIAGSNLVPRLTEIPAWNCDDTLCLVLRMKDLKHKDFLYLFCSFNLILFLLSIMQSTRQRHFWCCLSSWAAMITFYRVTPFYNNKLIRLNQCFTLCNVVSKNK